MIRTFGRALAVLAPLTFIACGSGECYVGVTGTAASITVKDTFPDETCQAIVANPAKYIGDIAEDSPKEFYSMSEAPQQPVVCEYTIENKHFIVRDEGMLKVVGNILCSGLSKRSK